MDNNYTHLVLVVDRSGSMGNTRAEAEGGVNALLEDQKKVEGKCTISLYQFDHVVDKVYECTDLSLLEEKYQLYPRGWTALYDAVGMAITQTEAYVDFLSEDLKPGTVIICIVTDGFENHSREFNQEQVRALIEKCKTRKWDVTFLGSDITTEEQGRAMGVSPQSVMAFSPSNTSDLYSVVSNKMSYVRSAKMSGLEASLAYDDIDKSKVSGTDLASGASNE